MDTKLASKGKFSADFTVKSGYRINIVYFKTAMKGL